MAKVGFFRSLYEGTGIPAMVRRKINKLDCEIDGAYSTRRRLSGQDVDRYPTFLSDGDKDRTHHIDGEITSLNAKKSFLELFA